tara:strand:- start:278 stop:817 length:540 start_codon:yes stop_codon:yes gene_type:complete
MVMRDTIMNQTQELLKPKNIYNNPGNIEMGQGFAGGYEVTNKTYADDRERPFVVFDSPEMGMRALAMDINSKLIQFNGNVSEIIKKYAPKEDENTTINYVNYVQNKVGKKNITREDIGTTMSAMIEFENKKLPGVVDYYLKDPKTMQTALALAFDKDGSNRQLPSDMSFEEAKIAAGLE